MLEYMLISEPHYKEEDFVRRVNDRITEGWRPQGGVALTPTYIRQAMVRGDEGIEITGEAIKIDLGGIDKAIIPCKHQEGCPLDWCARGTNPDCPEYEPEVIENEG